MNGDKFLKTERLPNFNVNQSDCIIFVGKLSILLGKGVRHIANHSIRISLRSLFPDNYYQIFIYTQGFHVNPYCAQKNNCHGHILPLAELSYTS
jgi:hypothetical protein